MHETTAYQDAKSRTQASKRGRLNRLLVVQNFLDSPLGQRVLDNLHASKNKGVVKNVENFIDKLVNGIITIHEAEGLLEPNQDVPEYAPSFDELYDALILRVNAYDCLDYLIGSQIYDDLEAVLLFFDGSMTEYHASQLMLTFKDILPGTQVVQMPDNLMPDKPWVFVCLENEITLLKPEDEDSEEDAIEIQATVSGEED